MNNCFFLICKDLKIIKLMRVEYHRKPTQFIEGGGQFITQPPIANDCKEGIKRAIDTSCVEFEIVNTDNACFINTVSKVYYAGVVGVK